MKRKLLVLAIGMMAMFLAGTAFADERFAAENLKSVDDIKGQNVLDVSGVTIGTIDDVLMDSKTGKVEYITLTSGGIFGVGGDKYLVPWQALQAAADPEEFQVNLSSAELENAPKGDEVPTQAQSREIHEFYGISPEWQENDGVSPEMQKDQDVSPSPEAPRSY